jgi:hypothetical protein
MKKGQAADLSVQRAMRWGRAEVQQKNVEQPVGSSCGSVELKPPVHQVCIGEPRSDK